MLISKTYCEQIGNRTTRNIYLKWPSDPFGKKTHPCPLWTAPLNFPSHVMQCTKRKPIDWILKGFPAGMQTHRGKLAASGVSHETTILESYVHHFISALAHGALYLHYCKSYDELQRRNHRGHDKFINTSELHQKTKYHQPRTRWAPTSYKWSYNLFK